MRASIALAYNANTFISQRQTPRHGYRHKAAVAMPPLRLHIDDISDAATSRYAYHAIYATTAPNII